MRMKFDISFPVTPEVTPLQLFMVGWTGRRRCRNTARSPRPPSATRAHRCDGCDGTLADVPDPGGFVLLASVVDAASALRAYL